MGTIKPHLGAPHLPRVISASPANAPVPFPSPQAGQPASRPSQRPRPQPQRSGFFGLTSFILLAGAGAVGYTTLQKFLKQQTAHLHALERDMARSATRSEAVSLGSIVLGPIVSVGGLLGLNRHFNKKLTTELAKKKSDSDYRNLAPQDDLAARLEDVLGRLVTSSSSR
jgi:hypothetical protein